MILPDTANPLSHFVLTAFSRSPAHDVTEPLVVHVHSRAGRGGTWSAYRGHLASPLGEPSPSLIVRVAHPDMMDCPSSVREEINIDHMVGSIARDHGIAPVRFGLFSAFRPIGVRGKEVEIWASLEADGGEAVEVEKMTRVER